MSADMERHNRPPLSAEAKLLQAELLRPAEFSWWVASEVEAEEYINAMLGEQPQGSGFSVLAVCTLCVIAVCVVGALAWGWL